MLNAVFKILYPFKTKKEMKLYAFNFFADVFCKSTSRDSKTFLELKHVNIVISD